MDQLEKERLVAWLAAEVNLGECPDEFGIRIKPCSDNCFTCWHDALRQVINGEEE